MSATSGEDVQAPTPIYVSQLDACPSCGEDWLYGEGLRFSRVIGVYDVRLDRTVAWRLPCLRTGVGPQRRGVTLRQ